jgi:hypothetical protein
METHRPSYRFRKTPLNPMGVEGIHLSPLMSTNKLPLRQQKYLKLNCSHCGCLVAPYCFHLADVETIGVSRVKHLDDGLILKLVVARKVVVKGSNALAHLD